MSSPPTIIRGNSQFSDVDDYTIPLSGSLALRAYSDTRPHNSHIADLQKGLILVHRGAEMVGEGTGFGVPALLYPDETYFSGSSLIHHYQQEGLNIIRKEFLMNRIHRKRYRETKLENQKIRSMLRYLYGLYQNHRHFRFLALKIPSAKMGIKTGFVKIAPAGNIIITYTIGRRTVLVRADFSSVKRENLEKVFVFNEQGSRFLRRYSDSNGVRLIDRQISAWEKIEAEWASITDFNDRVGFRLWRAENAILRTGREFVKDQRDWIGLDYEINPKNATFEYKIEILEA